MNARKRGATRAKAKRNPITLNKNELRIKFSNLPDLQHHLNTVSHIVSSKAAHQLLAYESGATVKNKLIDQLSSQDIPDLLGPFAANEIVTGCAQGEQDPSTKLGDIPGLDLLGFQRCVQQGIIAKGYKPGSIPATASTTLSAVMSAIQGCSK